MSIIQVLVTQPQFGKGPKVFSCGLDLCEPTNEHGTLHRMWFIYSYFCPFQYLETFDFDFIAWEKIRKQKCYFYIFCFQKNPQCLFTLWLTNHRTRLMIYHGHNFNVIPNFFSYYHHVPIVIQDYWRIKSRIRNY